MSKEHGEPDLGVGYSNRNVLRLPLLLLLLLLRHPLWLPPSRLFS